MTGQELGRQLNPPPPKKCVYGEGGGGISEREGWMEGVCSATFKQVGAPPNICLRVGFMVVLLTP